MKVFQDDLALYMMGLHRIFVIVRSQIRHPACERVIAATAGHLARMLDTGVLGLQAFFDEIKALGGEDEYLGHNLSNALHFTRGDYTTDNQEEIERYLPLLRDAVAEIHRLLTLQLYDRAYDLVDAIHFLPEVLLISKRLDTRTWWDHQINLYHEKWGNDLLAEYEKVLVERPERF